MGFYSKLGFAVLVFGLALGPLGCAGAQAPGQDPDAATVTDPVTKADGGLADSFSADSTSVDGAIVDSIAADSTIDAPVCLQPCDDGIACTDDVCIDGKCKFPIATGFCLIDSKCYPDGYSPAGSCNSCEAHISNAAWLNIDSLCQDDGLSCTNPRCDNGSCEQDLIAGTCLVDGVCLADGQSPPDDSCRVCDTGKATEALQDAADGSSCQSDGMSCTTDTCQAGTCEHQLKATHCLIQDVCYIAGEVNPSHDCQACDPSSADQWSMRADGSTCAADALSCTADVCSAGACTHELVANRCLIGGVCYNTGATNPLAECQECQPSLQVNLWQNKNTGTACTADGLSCTADQCNAGQCTHPINAGTCLIGGSCYADGQANPLADCQQCDAKTSNSLWSSEADGTSCTADAYACTEDRCKTGVCEHTIADGNCVIAGQCYAEGAPNPQAECQTCQSSTNKGNWTTLADGTACTADNYTCTADLCSAGQCTHDLMAGRCLIGGSCYDADDTISGSSCSICAPNVNAEVATAADGLPCSDGSSDTEMDTCLAGTCRGFAGYQWSWLSSDTDTAALSVSHIPGQGFYMGGSLVTSSGSESGFVGALNGAIDPSSLYYLSDPIRSLHYRLAVGDAGTARYHNGSSWVTATDVETQLGAEPASAVWGAPLASAGDNFFIGANGSIANCSTSDNGATFNCSANTGITSTATIVGISGLTSASGTQDRAWAIRGNAFEDIYSYDTSTGDWDYSAPWGCYDTSSNACGSTGGRLLDVWAEDSNDVWAVGEAGLVVRFNGTSWSKVTITSITSGQEDYDFHGVYSSGDVVLLVGNRSYSGSWYDLVLVAYNRQLDRWFTPRLGPYTTLSDANYASYAFHDIVGDDLTNIYIVGTIWDTDQFERQAIYYFTN